MQVQQRGRPEREDRSAAADGATTRGHKHAANATNTTFVSALATLSHTT